MSTSGLAGGVICSLHACASESQIASASKSSMGVKSSLSQSPQVIVPPAPLKKAEMVLQMFLDSLFLSRTLHLMCLCVLADGARIRATARASSLVVMGPLLPVPATPPHSCVLVGESMTHPTRLGR